MLRQWQPATIKRLNIKGWFPALLCSNHRTQFNYTYHSAEIPKPGPFGGNISITKWNLRILWYENKMLRNRWSRRNTDLDLVRYLGVTFRFYRDELKDYIVNYSLESPMQTDGYSHLRAHPQAMLLNRKHIFVPSLKTRKRGKKWVSVKIRPPRLMMNRWYFQKQFCEVNLLMLTISAMEVARPWLRAGTESPAVGFYCLDPNLYYAPSITLPDARRKEEHKSLWQFPYVYPTNWTQFLKDLDPSKSTNIDQAAASGSHTSIKEVFNSISLAEKAKSKCDQDIQNTEAKKADAKITTTKPTTNYLDRLWGCYSPFLLDPQKRRDPLLNKVFLTVRYNPLVDEGTGNKVWADSISKGDWLYDPRRSKCLIEGLPLWISLYGYLDYLCKETNDRQATLDYRILIISPWTSPKLTRNDGKGHVIYGDNFAAGRMPYRDFTVPYDWNEKWYPNAYHQQEALEAIVNCGPWMPRDNEAKSWQIGIGYKFRFLLGGNLPPGQPPGDPCNQPTHALPEPGPLGLAVQASDPGKVGDDGWPLHSWDLRRGLFSLSSIKRMQEYQTDDDSIAGSPAKIPRHDPGQAGTGFTSSSLPAHLQALQSPPESRLSPAAEEEEEQSQTSERLQLRLKLELERQRQRQLLIKRSIQEMYHQMQLMQQGHAIDNRLL